MNTKMNFFQKLIKSLYDFKSYNYFISETLGKGIIYLLLLVLVTTTFTSIGLAIKFNSTKEQLNETLITKLNNFNITDGILSIDSEMPITLSDDDTSDDLIMIIDTDDITDESILSSSNEGIIFYSDRFVVKNDTSPYNIQELYYSDIITNDLNSDDIIKFIDSFINIILVIAVIFSPIFSFIGKILSLFIVMGLGGLIISSILKLNLKYTQICTLGSYALTLPIILNTLVNLFNLSIPGFTIIYYVIGLIYLFVGMKSISIDENLDMMI